MALLQISQNLQNSPYFLTIRCKGNINNKQKEGNSNNFNHRLFQKCTNAVDTYLRKNKILKDKNQIIEIINHIYDIYLLKLTENIYFENIDYKDIENIVNLGNKKFS